ncbi:MAG: hypothetical protein FD135_3380 [Comamonadaceae bacterium]|nr:MAG: hypothetical protein FD135_3380 [Comamonadaceae bacterium]
MFLQQLCTFIRSGQAQGEREFKNPADTFDMKNWPLALIH